MIVIGGELVQSKAKVNEPYHFTFTAREDEGVYSLLNVSSYLSSAPGTVLVCEDIRRTEISDFGKEDDHIRVLVPEKLLHGRRQDNKCSKARGFVRRDNGWTEDEVIVVPVREQLCCRFGGLLETDVLANKRVFAPGLGSGGAPTVIGLVQSGVGNFDLMDDDRLEVGNIMRHPLGLSAVGRHKTKAMADFITDKNPYANVHTWQQRVGEDNLDLVRHLVRQADVVIGGTDNRESKILLNRICVEENTVLILANAYRRAYGGQVLHIRPHESLCYQCFLQTLPEQARDQEIASARQAEALAYTDRPVAIEPGLSLDIAPIAQMVTKLALMELLRGTETTLSSLYEDLVASLYIWLNRREKDTDFESLKPLAFEVDGMRVMRWYGASIQKDPACPVCGDFIGRISKEHGVTVSEEDLMVFEGGTKG